eukprot:TRINITY_DN2197_c3_g1_i1.p1 TRINITY_DN2197_c3_g1~~TRINITY_DN2197_c3_g1_i1.p1  ORF type:complete len:336 (+),score=125.71 TRINITY_DN2197_c3_g1_i1:46-1053(+)
MMKHMHGMHGMMGGFPPPGHPHLMDDAQCNLIVNYLPGSYNEFQVKQLFAQHGTVEKCKLISDPMTGQSKCFGFVVMSSPKEAIAAIRALSGYEAAPGKKLRVAYAQPSNVPSPSINVFLSGFGTGLNEEQIIEMCKKYGEVKEVKMLDTRKHPRGVAFVRFASVAMAEDCIHRLNGVEMRTPPPSQTPYTLAVKFAERKQTKHSAQRAAQYAHHPPGGMMPFPFPGMFPPGMHPPEHMHHHHHKHPFMGHGPGFTVFVHGLTAASEAELMGDVYNLFSVFGRIVRVDVPKHATGEPRNFCFCHFADFEGSRGALTLNGLPYKGRHLQVRYKYGP